MTLKTLLNSFSGKAFICKGKDFDDSESIGAIHSFEKDGFKAMAVDYDGDKESADYVNSEVSKLINNKVSYFFVNVNGYLTIYVK